MSSYFKLDLSDIIMLSVHTWEWLLCICAYLDPCLNHHILFPSQALDFSCMRIAARLCRLIVVMTQFILTRLPISFFFSFLMWFHVCFRRDHHHSPAGPRAEVRVHPDSQSCGWGGGSSAEDWHRHGNHFAASFFRFSLQMFNQCLVSNYLG